MRTFCTHKIPTKYQHFAPIKFPREKNLYPWKTHEKKFRNHKIPLRKNFGNITYPQEKFWTYKIPTKPQSHDDNRYTRSTMVRNSQNLKLLSIFSSKFTLAALLTLKLTLLEPIPHVLNKHGEFSAQT